MAAILWEPQSIILPIFLFHTWSNGQLPEVGALAVVMVLGLTTLTIAVRLLAQRRTLLNEM